MISVNVASLGTLTFPDGTPDGVIDATVKRELAARRDQEGGFRSWYEGHAQRLGLSPDPDDPEHHYDYRAAYKAGLGPDETGHWPSQFKADDHPNRFIDGVDTKDPMGQARRLRAERAAEMREMGALPPADTQERSAGFTDYVDRLGTAVLSNVSAPVDLAQLALNVANTTPGKLAVRALVPGGPSALQAMGSAMLPPARAVLSAAENVTNLPFTSESQQRHRERFRELEKPLVPGHEAAVDTALEGAGAFIDPVAAGWSALKVTRPLQGLVRGLSRVDALKNRIDDLAKLAAADIPPPPRVGAGMWAAYNRERAAIDAQVEAAIRQQIATTGQLPPPESITALRNNQVQALNQRWHGQAAAQAATSTEPSVHTLADQVEQPAAFVEAPELPMADLLELQQRSLRIAAPELRPDRTYRGTALHSDNPNARTYVYRDPVSGEDVGYLLAHPEPGERAGFKVKNVFVEESHRGGGIPEHLYSQAYDDLGPYKGSTDYAARRTPAGNGMHARLQRTVPHVFTDTGDSVVPTSSLIREGDPSKTIRQRLNDFANRFVEEMSDKKDPIIRTLKKAGLGDRANEIELWLSQARGAARVAANTVWKGVRHWDAMTGNVTRAYDSLNSIIGGLGKKGWRDLNDLFAAERHMSLLARKQDADASYAGELAARRAEIEARRQEVLGARADVRRATKEGRVSLARQLRAERNESKAAAQMDTRASVADVASRRRDSVLGDDPSQRDLGKATAYGRTSRENATLAESAATRLADASSFKANQAAIGDVLGDLAGASKTVEGAATRRYTKLPPRAQRPPDSLLRIDPRGTKWAQAKIAELNARYGTDPATGQLNQLGDIARRVREWSWQTVVEPLDQVGYFTPEAKAALAAQREVFAPFARLADDVEADLGLATGTQSKPLERIHGGLSPDKPIADPLESFVAQAQRITLWAERQRVFNQLGDAAEAFPAELGDTIKRLPPNGKNGFQVFRDGVRHVYSAPDDVMRALSQADPNQANWLVQAGVLAARTLRAGVTLSPDFAVRNFLRDQSTAGVYGAQFKFRPFSDFLVGVWAQTPFASPELRKMVFDWESAGGALGDIISVERPKATYTGKAAAGLAEFNLPGGRVFSIEAPRVAKHLAEWRAENYLGRVAYPFLRPLESAASNVEQATRIGAYRRAKLGGANDLSASTFSRNITLDFGRSGTFAQRWNSVEAFANASLQDVARFSRAMRERPFATTLTSLAYITLPSLAVYAMHRDNEDYQSRPQWEKASFYHLFQRKDKSWVMFPRPLGMLNLVFGYGIERMLEAMSGRYDEPVTELLSTIFQETPARFLPVQPDTDPNSATRFSFEPLPTGVQPAFEAGAGEEGWSQFRMSPLVPRALIELMPEDRYTDTTSVTARKIGSAIGQAPLKIDHLIRNYGGTLSVQALRMAERTLGSEQLPELPTSANDIPIAGAFVSGNPYGFATQPAQDFYKLEEAAREANNSLMKAAESKDVARYNRILRENPEALIADYLYDIRAGQKKDGPPSLAQLRQMRNEYRTVPGLSPEVRAERLLQTDMMISQTVISTMHWVAQWRSGYLAKNKGAHP